MKDIGYTQEGNRLVEMSQFEYDSFSRLCMAVEGKNLPDYQNPYEHAFRDGYDFSKTFDVIWAIYTEHFRVNELQNLLDEIKRSLSE